MDLMVESGSKSLGYLMDYEKAYFDLGDKNTFQITVRATKETAKWLKYGNLVYSPGTEYGGLVGRVKLSTKKSQYTVSGFTFRGLLEHKIIEPDFGKDYEILDPASGFSSESPDINECIAWILNKHCNDTVFVFYSCAATGINVTKSYQFKRYCTGLEGISAFVKGYGCRLEIKAVEEKGMCKVYVGAVPVTVYENLVENDGTAYFAADDNRMGINYLIALGKGELAKRLKVRLYVDEKTGTIKRIVNDKSGYPPVNGPIKAAIYEQTSEDNWTKLKEAGIEKLKELMNSQSASASVENIDAAIGDVVGASDSISGERISSPVVQKQVTLEAGTHSIVYKTQSEGEVNDEDT